MAYGVVATRSDPQSAMLWLVTLICSLVYSLAKENHGNIPYVLLGGWHGVGMQNWIHRQWIKRLALAGLVIYYSKQVQDPWILQSWPLCILKKHPKEPVRILWFSLGGWFLFFSSHEMMDESANKSVWHEIHDCGKRYAFGSHLWKDGLFCLYFHPECRNEWIVGVTTLVFLF